MMTIFHSGGCLNSDLIVIFRFEFRPGSLLSSGRGGAFKTGKRGSRLKKNLGIASSGRVTVQRGGETPDEYLLCDTNAAGAARDWRPARRSGWILRGAVGGGACATGWSRIINGPRRTGGK